jgi:ankyrin repeat protein
MLLIKVKLSNVEVKTPLHRVSRYGRSYTVKMLPEKGASITVKNKTKRILFDLAKEP